MNIGSLKPLEQPFEFEDDRDPRLDAEKHATPFGEGVPVCAFADSQLCDVVARYWRPSFYRDVVDAEGNVTGQQESALAILLAGVCTRGEAQALGVDPKRDEIPVIVRVVLSYPLHEHWISEVKIHANEVGRIFEIAFRMYVSLYESDAESHGGKAPRSSVLPGNRVQGSHVWGHDMTDLVFENVYFVPASDTQPVHHQNSYAKPPLLGTFGFGIGS